MAFVEIKLLSQRLCEAKMRKYNAYNGIEYTKDDNVTKTVQLFASQYYYNHIPLEKK